MRSLLLTLILVMVLGTAAGALSPTFDVLAGLGKTGPYPLSWAGIEPASETVLLGERALFRGLDYTVDYAKGAITFGQALAAGQMVRVTYRQLPTATANNNVVALPLNVPMGNLLGADLSMNYLYQGDPTKQALVVGMQAQMDTKVAQLTSNLLVSQGKDAAGNTQGRGLGLKLAGRKDFAKGSFTASLLRADDDFADPAKFGLAAGKQVLTLGGQYRANRALTATTNYVQTSDLTGAGADSQQVTMAARYQPGRALSAGTSVSTLTQTAGGADTTTRTSVFDLALTPAGQPSLKASHTVAQVEREGGDTTETVTDALALAAKLGQVGTATASHQIVSAGQSRTATTRFDLGATLVPKLATLKVGYSATDGAADAEQATALLDVTPSSRARLQATVGQSRTTSQQVEMAGLSATLQPLKSVSVAGSLKRRDYGATNIDTKTASVTVTPLPGLKVNTEYSENPEDGAGQPVQATSNKMGLSTQLGSLGVGGSYGRRYDVVGHETRLSEVSMSLAIDKKRRLYSSYQLASTLAADLASDTATYKVGYTHNAGADFSLSLEAQLLQYHDGPTLVDERYERRAEARLNARF